jgi:hypothetical protein
MVVRTRRLGGVDETRARVDETTPRTWLQRFHLRGEARSSAANRRDFSARERGLAARRGAEASATAVRTPSNAAAFPMTRKAPGRPGDTRARSAVTTMTGTLPSPTRILDRSSRPSKTGIRRSVMTTNGWNRASRSRATAPFSATATVYPSLSRMSFMRSTQPGSSSTTKTFVPRLSISRGQGSKCWAAAKGRHCASVSRTTGSGNERCFRFGTFFHPK